MNLSVHHVAVIVSDYAAAKHFYVDLLGLPVVRENCRGNGLWKLDLRLGDGELDKKLTVKAAKFTKSVQEKIVAAGGVAEEI